MGIKKSSFFIFIIAISSITVIFYPKAIYWPTQLLSTFQISSAVSYTNFKLDDNFVKKCIEAADHSRSHKTVITDSSIKWGIEKYGNIYLFAGIDSFENSFPILVYDENLKLIKKVVKKPGKYTVDIITYKNGTQVLSILNLADNTSELSDL